VLVVLGGARADLLLRELARERAKLLLLVGESERDSARDAVSIAPSVLQKNVDD
jgi:hypothetical protein